MATSGGPNVNRDGLVLYLDAPTNRSFRGEPTTNKAGGVYLGFNGGRWGKVTTYPQKGSLPFEVKGDVYRLLSGNNYWGNASSFSPAYNKTYTLSFWYYLSTNTNLSSWHNSFFGVPQGGGSQYATVSTKSNDTFSTTGTNTWRFGSVNISTNIAVDSYTYFRGTYTQGSADSMPNGDIYIANFQLEEKTSATRFTIGTRGTTVATGGGWRDISGNNNHGEILNGVTTDNDGDIDGALDFDGTDDYVPITNVLNSQSIGTSTQLTISLWLNLGSKGSRMAFSTGQTGNDRIYYWTQNGLNTWRVGNYTSTTGHTSLPSNGVWYHTAIVIDGLNVTGYFNGKEDYTGTYSAFTTVNYATLGRHGAANSYYYDGKIANVQIYEKALTSGEMLRNYKAVKSRYGL